MGLRILTFAALFAAGLGAQQQQSASDPAKGKDLFMKYSCYACHGFSGQNGSGARLVPMKMPAAAFVAYVRAPRTRQMPTYSPKVLSDQQLTDIHAYVKTLPESKPAKQVRALDQFQEK
jgi:ubiquinol-cytochrome c reductase cytochrome c subunit